MDIAADCTDPFLSATFTILNRLRRRGRLAAHQDKVLLAMVAEGDR